MTENIQKGVERLSIQPDESNNSRRRKKSTAFTCMPKEWVYGFHLKNRIVRRFARKYNLPYRTASFDTLCRVSDHIMAVSGVWFRVRAISCRGRSSRVLFFVESKQKSLQDLRFTQDEMDKVRQAMELPEGTKPKWYEVSENYSAEEEAERSSEDSDWDSDNPEGRSAKRYADVYDSDSDCYVNSDGECDCDCESCESDEIEVEGEAEESRKSKCENETLGEQ